jgi:ubiquinone biosynthesis protein UbiJ
MHDWVTILEGRINRDRREPTLDELLNHIRHKVNLLVEYLHQKFTEEQQSIMSNALDFAHELYQLKRAARKVINAYRRNDAKKLERAVDELERLLKKGCRDK